MRDGLLEFRPRPRRRDTTAYVGMVIFLGGWAMMFAGLFFAYALVRAKADQWPPPGEPRLPLALPALASALLVGQGVCSWLATRAVRLSGRAAVARRRAPGLWLLGALALGAAFFALQLRTWLALYAAGLTPKSGIYGSVFYALTGVHALHVLIGLLGLVSILPRALGGRFTPNGYAPLRVWSMYWHFVDAVWVLMFLTVYVL